jgi:hypothetical protein
MSVSKIQNRIMRNILSGGGGGSKDQLNRNNDNKVINERKQKKKEEFEYKFMPTTLSKEESEKTEKAGRDIELLDKDNNNTIHPINQSENIDTLQIRNENNIHKDNLIKNTEHLTQVSNNEKANIINNDLSSIEKVSYYTSTLDNKTKFLIPAINININTNTNISSNSPNNIKPSDLLLNENNLKRFKKAVFQPSLTPKSTESLIINNNNLSWVNNNKNNNSNINHSNTPITPISMNKDGISLSIININTKIQEDEVLSKNENNITPSSADSIDLNFFKLKNFTRAFNDKLVQPDEEIEIPEYSEHSEKENENEDEPELLKIKLPEKTSSYQDKRNVNVNILDMQTIEEDKHLEQIEIGEKLKGTIIEDPDAEGTFIINTTKGINSPINKDISKIRSNTSKHRFKLTSPCKDLGIRSKSKSKENQIKRDYKKISLLPMTKSKEDLTVVPNNTHTLSHSHYYNNNNNKHSSNSKISKTNKDFTKYDVQHNSYDIAKKYAHLKIENDRKFIDRMDFYAIKKQFKDNKINELLQNKKVKIKFEEKVDTFNRLIKDANRRTDGKRRVDIHNENTDSILPEVNSKSKEKMTSEKWDKIYKERFEEKQRERDKRVKIEQIKKEKVKKQFEEKLMEEIESKRKKVSADVADKITNRLYNESERRKFKSDFLSDVRSVSSKSGSRLLNHNNHIINKNSMYFSENNNQDEDDEYLNQIRDELVSHSHTANKKPTMNINKVTNYNPRYGHRNKTTKNDDKYAFVSSRYKNNSKSKQIGKNDNLNILNSNNNLLSIERTKATLSSPINSKVQFVSSIDENDPKELLQIPSPSTYSANRRQRSIYSDPSYITTTPFSDNQLISGNSTRVKDLYHTKSKFNNNSHTKRYVPDYMAGKYVDNIFHNKI